MAALADQALAFAAMTIVPSNASFRTIKLQVNFIMGGRAHPLCIKARVVATTERLITVRADFCRDDGKLIAEASAQQLVAAFGTSARTRCRGYPSMPIPSAVGGACRHGSASHRARTRAAARSGLAESPKRATLTCASCSWLALWRWCGKQSRAARSGRGVAQLLERKKPEVAAVALANKNARIIWAMMATGEPYRETELAAA